MYNKTSQIWHGIRQRAELAELSGKMTALAMALFFLLQVVVFSLPAHAAQLCATWNAVTTNSDGSALTDLSHYVVHSGQASNSYSLAMNAGTGTSHCYTVSAGHYCVMVTAFDTSGNESLPSSEACIDVAAGSLPSPSPTPGGNAPARAIPGDFTGAGSSNIVTVKKSSRSSSSPLLFTIYNSDASVHSEISIGKYGNVPAVADYDGDGITDLAVVARAKGKLVWNIRNNAGVINKVNFGKSLSSVVGGCHFDSDLLADETVLASKRLQYLKSSDSSIANVRLTNLPPSTRGISCADLDGDGIFELIVLGKGYKPGLRPGRGVKQTWQLISYNATTGQQVSNFDAVSPSGVAAGDINNDGIAEMAYIGRSTDKTKSTLNFFVSGSSAPVPIEVAKFNSLVGAKIGSGSGRVANGLLYTPKGSQAVISVSFDDLIANATSVVLSKASKEKLVSPK